MKLSRRRFLTITAASGLAATAGLTGKGLAGSSDAAGFTWQGSALGAQARLTMLGMDRSRAEHLSRVTMAEVARLERCFSLHRADSELSRLNAAGRLDAPSQDFRRLVDEALFYWEATEGAFNPALQPLWALLHRHFAASPAADDPPVKTVMAALALAKPDRIDSARARVRMTDGMALTFNGIAQGYITDRVGDLLKSEGCEHVLVELGEWRALPGRPWSVTVPAAGMRIDLEAQALAVSRPMGTPLSADGRWHHLLDPESGRSAVGVDNVVVRGPRADAADALSTAFTVADKAKRSQIAKRFREVDVAVDTPAGREIHGNWPGVTGDAPGGRQHRSDESA